MNKDVRIIVFSDSHGDISALEKVVKENPKVESFLFLGDGERDIKKLKDKYEDKDFFAVKGNCDIFYPANDVDTITFGDVKILFCHGHTVGVKGGVEHLFYLAKENECQIALFGHTHARYKNYHDGVHIFNPGSVALPRDFKKASYGYIDITKNGIHLGHKEL